MKRFRIIGLSLLALLALGAFAASTASAVEGVLPLKLKNFTLLSTIAKLETAAGVPIECAELKGKGVFSSDIAGTATLDFLGCNVSGFPAFSLGDAVPTEVKTALILVPVSFLVCLINSAALTFGIFVELKESLHIDALVLGELDVLLGAIIGELSPNKGKLAKLVFTGAKGKQTLATKCVDETGGEKTNTLKASINGGAFEPASQNVAGGLIQFEEEQELMDKKA